LSEERASFLRVDILAIVTLSKERIMGGKQLTIHAKNEEEQKSISHDLALTLKGDLVKLKTGDHLIVR